MAYQIQRDNYCISKSIIAYFLFLTNKSFIPTEEQVQYLVNLNKPRVECISLWHDMLWNDDIPSLFQLVPKSGDVLEDQLIRARELINLEKEEETYHIQTMDGHGRFLLSLIHVLLETGEDVNRWTFTFIDNNYTVHRWHELFFPNASNIRLIHGDILDNIDNNATVYFNFCGTENEDFRYDLYNTIRYITKNRENKLSVMLSLSIRGARCKLNNNDELTNYGLYKAILGGGNVVESINDDGTVNLIYLPKLKSDKVCIRHNFVTLKVLKD